MIMQDLISFRARIQGAAMMLHLNPVVIELDYTEIPVQVDIGSVQTVPAIKTCQCDVPLAQKWNHMVELAQKSTSQKILVRALLPGGTSERVKLQCLPLKRILGNNTPATDEEPMSEFDETFNLLYSRAGQSFGVIDAAFPNEAIRALREKSGIEERKL